MLGAFAIATAAAAVSATPRAAHAQLFSQADLVTNPGGGFGGADLSAVQNVSLGLNAQGFFNTPNLQRAADNFSVTGGPWNITSFRFFGWLANSGTTSPFDFISWRVWDARPGDVGASVVAGDISTNALQSTGFTNIYRAFDAAPTNTQRPIMYIDAVAAVTLGPGDYWLEWVFDVPSGIGFIPPVTIPGVASTGNGRLYNGPANTWVDAMDGDNAQGLPFQVFGTVNTVVPEPGTYTLLGAGVLALAFVRRRKAVVVVS